MHLEIITPVKPLYSGDVILVRLPGSKGGFEILKGHAPIISSLEKGVVKIIDENKIDKFCQIGGGVVECKSDNIIVLADNGEMTDQDQEPI
jgi:F-type H+-transporting ATPase subunit epsilon